MCVWKYMTVWICNLQSKMLHLWRYLYRLHSAKNGRSLIWYPTSIQERTKSDSFSAHFDQHFKAAMSRTYLRKYMPFKLVKQLNLIGAMKTITKPNWNLCMKERLTKLKKLREKCVTIMNKNSEVYWACRHKTTFDQFFLSTDDPVFVFIGLKE